MSRPTHNWTEIWARHLDGYLSEHPRAGFAIMQMLAGDFDSVLEIACGSGRDSLFLQSVGKQVFATDGDPGVISVLQKRFCNTPRIAFSVEDALALSFADKRFDASFHNGFLGYFDDEIVRAILREQWRVTRKEMIFLVHNAHNLKLKSDFLSRTTEDILYDIRFFSRDDIARLVRESNVGYRQMRIRKFGGLTDAFIAPRLKGFRNPFNSWARNHLTMLYSLTPLASAERLLCWITL